jgi:hypothetical protein
MNPHAFNRFQRILGQAYLFIFFALSLLILPKRKVIVFGGAPIVKFGRWSSALKSIKYDSVSLVPSVYSINSKDQFDYVWLDMVPKYFGPLWVRKILAPGISYLWVIRNARVICSPVGGISFFGWFGFENLEFYILKMKSIKTVTVTGGGDAYMLGSIHDPSLRIGLQASYPERARMHVQVEKSVRRSEKYSDLFIASQMALDGFARNDFVTPHMGAVNHQDRSVGSKKMSKEHLDSIKILHAPNHRHFKGTSFIQDVIKTLCSEGIKIDFLLLEGLENSELMEKLAETDIAIDQVIMPGYSNFAIEALSFGIPTIANLGGQEFRQIMGRYSFLDECPLISSTPETLYNTLSVLIKDQKLRDSIGAKSREFANCRHSYQSWQNLWAYFEENDFDGKVISSTPNASFIYQRA